MVGNPNLSPFFAEIASQEVIYWGSTEREQFAAHVMNLDGRWKYIRNRFDIDELYDLETDSRRNAKSRAPFPNTNRALQLCASKSPR